MTAAELRAWDELLRAERARREAELAVIAAEKRFADARRRGRRLRLLAGNPTSRLLDQATEEGSITARRR